MMMMMKLTILVCGMFCVPFVTSLTKEEFDECESALREILCGLNNDDVLKELEECDKLVSEDLANVFKGCEAEASPDNAGTVDFTKAACADEKIFQQYDKCLEPHKEDESFLKKIEESDEATECYEKVMDKNGLLTEEMKSKRRK